MFTTSQKINDARVNARIFFSLALAGAIAGAVAWFFSLPAELAAVPPWRLAWALLADPVQRQFWESNFSVISHFYFFHPSTRC